jgi:hypothetical protein
MLEKYFCAPKVLVCLRAGLSGPYIDAFADALKTSGYSAEIATDYLRIAAHLGHFLQRGKADLSDTSADTLERFLRHLPRCRCPQFEPRKANYNARCLRRLRRLTHPCSPEVDHVKRVTMGGHARCPEETVPDLPAVVPARRESRRPPT